MQEYKPPEIPGIPATEQILYSTFRITSDFGNNQIGHGTGFAFDFCKRNGKHAPCILTNKHVVHNAKLISFPFRLLDEKGEYLKGNYYQADIFNPIGTLIYHPDPNVDLVAITIGQIINKTLEMGFKPYYIPMDETLLPTSEQVQKYMIADTVLMVGYPNGLWDTENNLPIVRKGILSTLPKYDYGGKKEFVIDMACLNGSSGSPVFYYDTNFHQHSGNTINVTPKIKLLGLLYGGPEYTFRNEFQETDFALKAPILNLGYVIKHERIIELDAIVNIEVNH